MPTKRRDWEAMLEWWLNKAVNEAHPTIDCVVEEFGIPYSTVYRNFKLQDHMGKLKERKESATKALALINGAMDEASDKPLVSVVIDGNGGKEIKYEVVKQVEREIEKLTETLAPELVYRTAAYRILGKGFVDAYNAFMTMLNKGMCKPGEVFAFMQFCFKEQKAMLGVTEDPITPEVLADGDKKWETPEQRRNRLAEATALREKLTAFLSKQDITTLDEETGEVVHHVEGEIV